MKRKLLLSLLIILNSFYSFSQDLIAVQNGGTPTFYEDLQVAITNAQAGDTLYLPGRSYSINATINKELHFVGVGHHPDFTSATNKTIIVSANISQPQIILDDGADGGSITGIYFANTGGSYPKVNIIIKGSVFGYKISKNYLINGFGSEETGNPQSLLIYNNIIGFVGISSSGSNNVVSNNIITNIRSAVLNCLVKNNIFLSGYDGMNYGLRPSNSVVENNIFNFNSLYLASLEKNSIIKNNLNGGLNGVNNYGTQGSGNFLGSEAELLENVFVNYTGSFDSQTSDLHLIISSPFANAGTDGTDLGIYGGAYPWQDGSVPFNPHIVTKQIAPVTDSNGNLQITIKVKAQDN